MDRDLREAAKALLAAHERYRETDDIDTLDDAVIDAARSAHEKEPRNEP